MKRIKPKSIIIFAFVFFGAIVFTGIMIMERYGYISYGDRYRYILLNAVCGLVFIAWGTILSIINDKKTGKKIRPIQKASLIYCGVGFIGILLDFIL